MTRVPPRLTPTGPDSRARPDQPPSREAVEELARRLDRGSYRVDPRKVAEAILTGRRPPERRG